MVSGNHHLYGSDMAVTLPRMAGAAETTGGRFRFLDDAPPILTSAGGGRRVAVLGGTLWTDYRLNGAEHLGELGEQQNAPNRTVAAPYLYR